MQQLCLQLSGRRSSTLSFASVHELSSFVGAQNRSLSQLVAKAAADREVQTQDEVLSQEAAASESKTTAAPITEGTASAEPELPPSTTAEPTNQKEGVNTGKFWLLRSTNEEGKSKEIVIPGDGIMVGAAPKSDGSSMPLVVDFPMVSSTHARVFGRERRTYQTTIHEYFVMDLGSTNGTYLNRSKLRPQTEVKLSRGDTLKFGDESAVFVVESQS
ncbi:hypothetical protein GOP47_0006047 [Adiantum capillus-veneris]|uniref:FHA domain-containing protein n=1 Tax=Adiantum capillus-veneris TaxID=13818 RepID=A0A9D4V250_ADICA|nr:hypothetical protein GOP47_0006047 [Adiantum capillus-veneris]